MGLKLTSLEEHHHGSIVAALYAMGYTAQEMLNLFDYFGKTIVDSNPMYMLSSMKENKSFEINGMRSGASIEYAVNEAAKYKNLKKIQDLKKYQPLKADIFKYKTIFILL